jgi:hypothetical protein
VRGGQITVGDEAEIAASSLIATSGNIEIGDHVNVSAVVTTGSSVSVISAARTIRFGNFSRLLSGSLNAGTVIVGESAELSGGVNTAGTMPSDSLLVLGVGARTIDGSQRARTLVIEDGVDLASTVTANQSTRFLIDHRYTVSGGTVISEEIELEPGVQVGGALSAWSVYLGAGSRMNQTATLTNLYGPLLNETSAYVERIVTQGSSVKLQGNLTFSIDQSVGFSSQTVTLAANTHLSGGALALGGGLLIGGANVTLANFTLASVGSFRVLPESENYTVGGPTTLRYLSSGFTEIAGKLNCTGGQIVM